MKSLKCGDEVAVLPHAGALPQDVLDIATIVYVCPKLTSLTMAAVYMTRNTIVLFRQRKSIDPYCWQN